MILASCLKFYFNQSCGFVCFFSEKKESKEKKKKDEPSSMFQRQRVDLLLNEISRKFPPKFIPPIQPTESKGKDNFDKVILQNVSFPLGYILISLLVCVY